MDDRPGARARAGLVAALRERGAASDPAVLAAFAAVPRELFLPAIGVDAAYEDAAVVTKRDARGMPLSSSSQPAMMARMLELLDVRAGMRVLEIGAGTGYNAALLEQFGADVTTLDVAPEIAAEASEALARCGCAARVVCGDGRDGHAAGAPYDRIVVTATAERVASAWMRQLRPGGRIVVPLVRGDRPWQLIPAFTQDDGALHSVAMTSGAFMFLHDGDGPPPRGPLELPLGGPGASAVAALAEGEPAVTEHGPLRCDASVEPSAFALCFAERLDPQRRVTLFREERWSFGVAAADGFAAVSFAADGRWRLDAYGSPDAAAELRAELATCPPSPRLVVDPATGEAELEWLSGA